MKTLGSDDAQAGVGIAENEDCIWLDLYHELVGSVDDVAHCGSKVVAYRVHIDFRIREFEIAEEDAVEIVVVVLAGVG